MSSPANVLAQLESRLDALSVRERVIVTVALTALILFAGLQLGIAPQWQAMSAHQKQAERLNEDAALLQVQLPALEQRLSDDPNRLLRQRNEELARQLELEGDALQLRMDGLVKPQHMAALLEQLLVQSPGLSVVGLDKIPARAMRVRDGLLIALDSTSKAELEPGARLIYRHGLKLTLEGGYLDTLAYIKRLEAMEQTLLLNRLDFEVMRYPLSRAVLEVETLSLVPGWLGGVK